MATKRQILESLKHKDLLAIAESFELSIENRRLKGNVVDAVVASRNAKLTNVLKEFSLAQLKETCRKLKIEVSGRTKVDFIEGLLGKKSVKAISTKAKPAKAIKAKTQSPASKTKAKAKAKTKAKAPTKAKTTVAKTAKPEVKAKENKATEKKSKSAPKKAKAPIKKPKKKEDAPKPLEAKSAPEASPESHPSAPDYSRVSRPTAPSGPSDTQCIACKATVVTTTCQANDCDTPMLETDHRKICAGCWFDRSGGSFDFFLREYKKDTTCPKCEKQWANFDD